MGLFKKKSAKVQDESVELQEPNQTEDNKKGKLGSKKDTLPIFKSKSTEGEIYVLTDVIRYGLIEYFRSSGMPIYNITTSPEECMNAVLDTYYYSEEELPRIQVVVVDTGKGRFITKANLEMINTLLETAFKDIEGSHCLVCSASQQLITSFKKLRESILLDKQYTKKDFDSRVKLMDAGIFSPILSEIDKNYHYKDNKDLKDEIELDKINQVYPKIDIPLKLQQKLKERKEILLDIPVYTEDVSLKQQLQPFGNLFIGESFDRKDRKRGYILSPDIEIVGANYRNGEFENEQERADILANLPEEFINLHKGVDSDIEDRYNESDDADSSDYDAVDIAEEASSKKKGLFGLMKNKSSKTKEQKVKTEKKEKVGFFGKSKAALEKGDEGESDEGESDELEQKSSQFMQIDEDDDIKMGLDSDTVEGNNNSISLNDLVEDTDFGGQNK